MKYALLADIHSNREALTAVLEDIDRRGTIEELWILGDIVGYGPDPGECIKILRSRKHRGSLHDEQCSGDCLSLDITHIIARRYRVS